MSQTLIIVAAAAVLFCLCCNAVPHRNRPDRRRVPPDRATINNSTQVPIHTWSVAKINAYTVDVIFDEPFTTDLIPDTNVVFGVYDATNVSRVSIDDYEIHDGNTRVRLILDPGSPGLADAFLVWIIDRQSVVVPKGGGFYDENPNITG